MYDERTQFMAGRFSHPSVLHGIDSCGMQEFDQNMRGGSNHDQLPDSSQFGMSDGMQGYGMHNEVY